MCGIIGYTGKKDAVSIILDGLRRLEYRGYDSAGVAFFGEKGIEVRRCRGRIRDLDALIEANKPFSPTGIGHTRWATHGKPSEDNAHPHRSDGIVLVHNGIIENYLDLKRRLQEEGFKFTSETDTEVLCHLINKHINPETPLEDAVRKALKDVRGAYAIAVMNEKEPGKIVGIRKDSPLVIGVGEGEFFIASDVPAFLNYSRNVIFLDEGEMVVITEGGMKITTLDGVLVHKNSESVSWSPAMAEKGGYKHFMLKEIFEQPRSIADTLRGRFYPESGEVNMEEFGIGTDDLKDIEKIFIVACGTSWHASLVGKYIIEELARVPVDVDIASEFRYRNPILGKSLFIAITQSGETADTLAAMREAKKRGAKTLTICNVVGSTAAREADAVFYTHSGPEIGVASTKAFTAQIIGLYLFAAGIAHMKGRINSNSATELLRDLLFLPEMIEKVLAKDSEILKIAKELFKAEDFLYLGRGINYPIALEGALKLKEISYIHAEGYPAGEMKHGPIALIDEAVPSVFLLPKDRLYEKVLSNIEEVRSRGGKIIAVTNDVDEDVCNRFDYCISVPDANPFLSTILMIVPLQLLAYHVGVLRGCDVDQPRNLAKSVTVE
ncbi:MAG: glutamine--fructose-6-phosphate transaminase (isomerizing) [Nitrospirae bacterium]|nr:glutamine--fructose-6-phosphate transaminase (isomerizing) [Nitrospirota bacterium]